MEKQRAKVRLDRKPFVWGLTVEGISYAAQLRGEALHVLPIPNVFNHRIRKSYVKRFIWKLQVASVSDHAPVISRLQFSRVLVEQRNVVGLIEHAPYLRRSPDIQYRAAGRRWKSGAEQLNSSPPESFHEEVCDSRILHLISLGSRSIRSA
jgi:hypothetical protein